MASKICTPILLTHKCRKARFPGHKCDSLILGFGDAKISIVEFDAATRDLVTTGMYCLDHKLRTVRASLCGRRDSE
jgi:hypothetical protein